MIRFHPILFAMPLAAALALAGCGKAKSDAESGGHDHEEHADAGEAPARFKEGQGLFLVSSTAEALGLKTGEVEERPVTHTYEVTASVFDAGPPARASSLMPVEIADDLEKHPPTEAKLLAVRRDIAKALDQVEVVFALSGSPEVGTTVTLILSGPVRNSAAVPHSALLRTATGTFVYVVNGTYLLRTPVQSGASDGAFIEILDGLYAGDVVATAAVEQLWLTELRLTKGGGHSH
jgi:hypothetical protein